MKYKAGIIGCGGISGSHFNGLKKTGKAEIVYAWDMNEEAVNNAVSEYGVKGVNSAEEVINSDADIIVIATPGFAHLEYVQQAAKAGKHIICEKPIALNLDDAEAMREAVEKASITFQVSFNQRNHPPFVTLKRFEETGRLKGLVSAWARMHAPQASAWWEKITKTGHWRGSMELSGGRINEYSSHTVNWLLWVLGKPKTVYGKALHVTQGFELDDADYAIIECEKGIGMLEVNRHAAVVKDENYGIMGHGGSIVLKDENITFKPMDEDPEEVPVRDDVLDKHSHFIECVEKGVQPLVDIESAIETLRVCIAFNKSAETGEVVKCG
jgi:predicted dehydrogenase